MEAVKVFKTKVVNTRRKHQCFKCGFFIQKKELMRNTTYSYDNRLVSLYSCECCEGGLKK